LFMFVFSVLFCHTAYVLVTISVTRWGGPGGIEA